VARIGGISSPRFDKIFSKVVAVEYNTYLWQEVKGEHVYRVQSDDPVIIRKLKALKGSRLIGQGINRYQAIFVIEFESRKEARNIICEIAGSTIVVEDKSGVIHIVTYKHHSRNEQLNLL